MQAKSLPKSPIFPTLRIGLRRDAIETALPVIEINTQSQFPAVSLSFRQESGIDFRQGGCDFQQVWGQNVVTSNVQIGIGYIITSL